MRFGPYGGAAALGSQGSERDGRQRVFGPMSAITPFPPPVIMAVKTGWSLRRHVFAGFLLKASDPRALVFWLAKAAAGSTRGGNGWLVAAFVAGAFANSFGRYGAWALPLSSASVRAGHVRMRRWVEGALRPFFAVASNPPASARI